MQHKMKWLGLVLASLMFVACGGGDPGRTATGPLRNATPATQKITHGDLFTWAPVAFPQYFPGTPTVGRYEQYDFRLYASGNYLAVDDDEVIWVMGPSFGSAPVYIGPLAQYAPLVLAWQATQPRSAYRGKVLISAWKEDGSEGSIYDFVEFTHYRINRWSMYSNYGLYPLGKPPAGAQVGSDISLQNIDGVNYVVMDISTNQTFYFTALWKAPTIGTVFMRADAQGDGYLISNDQPQRLELPYHFARDEFRQAQRMLAGATLTPQAQALLEQATAAMTAASSAATPSARAVAAYTALSYVMP
jgi:hypothetical protein